MINTKEEWKIYEEFLFVSEENEYELVDMYNCFFCAIWLMMRLMKGKKTLMIQLAPRLVDHKGSEKCRTMCFYFISMCCTLPNILPTSCQY